VIDVCNDAEGVRMALEEIFEEDYVRSRIGREMEAASEETRKRMAAQVPNRTLSPGYYAFADHLLWLESERSAGVGFAAGALAAFEVRGLVALGRARTAFDGRHPKCSCCGARQQNRFSTECLNCGAKFRRKGQ
jgi:hypothetical protein